MFLFYSESKGVGTLPILLNLISPFPPTQEAFHLLLELDWLLLPGFNIYHFLCVNPQTCFFNFDKGLTANDPYRFAPADHPGVIKGLFANTFFLRVVPPPGF